MPLISVRDLVIQAPGNHTSLPLLDHVNIDIPEHDTIGLTGPSGGGKTLLAKFLTGLLPPNLEVSLDTFQYREKKVNHRKLSKYRGKILFYTPQNPAAALNPVRKIKFQLAEGLSPRPGHRQLTELLDELNISSPARVMNSYSFQLSGGESQRIVLAMALLRKPELLVLDEPTASLDPEAGKRFLTLLQKLKSNHLLTVLLITHQIPPLQELCSKLYRMENGKLTLQPSQKNDALQNQRNETSLPWAK